VGGDGRRKEGRWQARGGRREEGRRGRKSGRQLRSICGRVLLVGVGKHDGRKMRRRGYERKRDLRRNLRMDKEGDAAAADDADGGGGNVEGRTTKKRTTKRRRRNERVPLPLLFPLPLLLLPFPLLSPRLQVHPSGWARYHQCPHILPRCHLCIALSAGVSHSPDSGFCGIV